MDPFLSEEEVCGDALQAVEATCVHEQTEAWCLGLLQQTVLLQRNLGKRGEMFQLRDSWQVVSGLG